MISSNDSFQPINLAKPAGYIYKITNLVNGKVYVGQTNDTKKRWMDHKSALRGNRMINSHLQASWNKYGESNFKFEILDIVVFESGLDRLEQFYINSLGLMNNKNGYNKLSGGNSNKKHSQETIDKLKAKKRTPEQKQRYSNCKKGIKQSPEHTKKCTAAKFGHTFNRGRVHVGEGLKNIQNSNRFSKDKNFHKKAVEKSALINRKKIIDSNGVIYISLTEAAKKNNTYISTISRSLIKGLCANKLRFYYYKEDKND